MRRRLAVGVLTVMVLVGLAWYASARVGARNDNGSSAGFFTSIRSVTNGSGSASLATVRELDVQRYAGTWYELARYPAAFQCGSTVSTATYRVTDAGTISVVNRSYLGQQQTGVIRGSATAVNGDPARLRVRFGGLLRLIPSPRRGNYYVLDVAHDYSVALVGSPDRRYLWVLPRDPFAWGSAPVQHALVVAQQRGFDPQRLLVADWKTRRMRD